MSSQSTNKTNQSIGQGLTIGQYATIAANCEEQVNTNDVDTSTLTQEDLNTINTQLAIQAKYNLELEKSQSWITNKINEDEQQISENEDWIDDNTHWYQFGVHHHGVKDKEEENDQLQKQVDHLQKASTFVNSQLDKVNAEIAIPVEMLNLQTQKILKQLSDGEPIDSSTLKSAMMLMAQVMAIVEVVLSKVDETKGKQQASMSETECDFYKFAVQNSNSQIDEMKKAEHKEHIFNIIGKVVEAVVVTASILIAGITGGAGSVLVAAAIGVFMMSGAMNDMTEAIANALPEGSGFKILADVISMAIVTVATLGVGAVSAGVEAVMQAALTNATETVVNTIVDETVETFVSEAVDNITEDTTETAVKKAAEEGARSVGKSVAEEVANVVQKNAIRSVLRKSLIGTLKQGLTATTKEAVETAVKEAVQEALANATDSITSAASTSARVALKEETQSAADDLIASLTKNATEQAVKTASKDALSTFGVSFTQAAKTGAAIGVFGTNLLPDLLQPLVEKIFGKDSEISKILMDILEVINAILSLIVVAYAGGASMSSTEEELSKELRGVKNAAQFAQVIGGVCFGSSQIAKGSSILNQSKITKETGKNEEIITTMNLLTQQLAQLMRYQQSSDAKKLKSETNGTLETINQLNLAEQAYANVLASTAI